MTNKSYSSNYLKIYIWQGAAFILRFLSMFIVTPYITKEPSTYGIYSVCISVTIFLNYADLGFLRAGQKYAAEHYIKGDRIEEMKFIGFGIFILLVFTLICASVFLYLGYNPQALIKGLNSPAKINTASQLLIILALFTPVTVLQRMVSMIFEIRLAGYIIQRISLVASLVTIGSVYYFFRKDNYQIVPYFFFSQFINLIVVNVWLWLAKTKYKYSITKLIRCIRFDTTIYKKGKSLAYSGMYIMIFWILFYELDQIVISKALGSEKVAVYAIAFTFASLFRTIYGILYAPFTVRANHFVGNNDGEGLKKFCFQLFSLSAPLIIIPTLAFAIITKPLIMTWVGPAYNESINLARLFSLIFTLSFISYTVSTFLIATVRIKEMYLIASIQPLIYWSGILSTFSFLGLFSFGIFKFVATFVSEAYYFYIVIHIFNFSIKDLFQKVLYPILIPLVFLITSLTIACNFLPYEKSKMNLLFVLGTTGISILLSFGILYITSTNIRIIIKNIFNGKYAVSD